MRVEAKKMALIAKKGSENESEEEVEVEV